MTDELDIEQKLKQRRRAAVDVLLESSHLRDALTDTQAQELLDWAIARIDDMVAETAVLPDDQAEVWLEEQRTALFGILKGINRLTPKLATLDQEEAEYQMENLLTNLQQINGSVNTFLAQSLLLSPRDQLDVHETFCRLMDIVTQQDEEE